MFCLFQKLDGYLFYLYGIILKKLCLNKLARQMLLEAITREPSHWGAWLELSGKISTETFINFYTFINCHAILVIVSY